MRYRAFGGSSWQCSRPSRTAEVVLWCHWDGYVVVELTALFSEVEPRITVHVGDGPKFC